MQTKPYIISSFYLFQEDAFMEKFFDSVNKEYLSKADMPDIGLSVRQKHNKFKVDNESAALSGIKNKEEEITRSDLRKEDLLNRYSKDDSPLQRLWVEAVKKGQVYSSGLPDFVRTLFLDGNSELSEFLKLSGISYTSYEEKTKQVSKDISDKFKTCAQEIEKMIATKLK
jgi:hypothetical protein